MVVTIPDLGLDSLEFMLQPVGSPGAWLLGGNAGTTSGMDYIGTADAAELHLYVNGGANNSLILNLNRSLQRDTGGDGRGAHAVDLQISRSTSQFRCLRRKVNDQRRIGQ